MRRFCILLLAALAWCAQAGAADLAPQGSLVIVGGALRSDNAVVWQRIVQLAGGAGARIAVLPSAAANPEGSGAHLAAYLNRYGASAFVVPLAVRLPNRDYRRDAEDATLARSIREAGGVYFCGGDQALITQALVRPDGSRSAVLEAIWDVYRRGGVIAGTSAGAAIMSSTMFDSTRSVFSTLAQGVNDGRELAPGLGFIGKDIFVDQHLLARGRFARMLPAMLKKGYKLGLGIDENTAMVINAARDVEVLGYQGALLMDLSQAAVDPGARDFNISNVRVSYLDRGDRYNLASRQFTPSADKVEGGKLDPQKPATRAPVYTSDILGHNAVLVLMEKLIDNSQTEATGIATAGPGEARQDLGFEFHFTRLADSIGYASATTEGYSILNLRLDVRPLQITRPWYK
ncbi:cyanophycinase [Duganella vulcania]|uniref:Cyanophycinase n=1 Tax=Duganella vulcania TaxID=2692166 RepID=A0A845GMK8_9BURK|nr:cyanophycinase [Duganella vulcania]MYM95803.1 cyanophycinase [Duganella vulcania]